MRLLFYPLDIDHNENGIRLLGVTKDNKKVCVHDDSLKPYFWILNNKIENIEVEEYDAKVTSVKNYKKEYLGNEVDALKVEVNKQSAIKYIIDEIRSLNLEKKEIDINYSKRYLVDKNIKLFNLTEVDGELIEDNRFDYCIKGDVKQFKESYYLEKI